MAIKLKKTLYVGLGGTGVSALLKVKKCFYDSYGEIPPMIGFLAIDTDGAATNKSETSDSGKVIKLDPAYSGDSRSPIPMISVHSVGDLLYRRQS